MSSAKPWRWLPTPSFPPPIWGSLVLLFVGFAIILAVQWNRESRALLDDWTGEKAAELFAAVTAGLETLPEKDWNPFIATLAGPHVPSILIAFDGCETVALSNSPEERDQPLTERIGAGFQSEVDRVRTGISTGETWTAEEGRSFLFPLRVGPPRQSAAGEVKGVLRLIIDDRFARDRLLRARLAGGASIFLLALLLLGGGRSLLWSQSRNGAATLELYPAGGGGSASKAPDQKDVGVLERVRRRTEELAAKTREFEGVVQSIPDTVLRLRDDGEITFFKEASEVDFVKTLGLFSRSDLGRATSNVLGRALVKEALRAGRDMRSRGRGSAVAEMEIGGGAVELRVAPLVDGGYLVLARDFSVRRKLEDDIKQSLKREKELSEMKSQFISVASHEFRTPMSAIAFSADLLQNFSDRIQADKKAELIDRILNGVYRLRSIVDDVLVLSRVDAGRVEVSKAPTNLAAFFMDVLEEARVQDKRKHSFELRAGDSVTIDRNSAESKLLSDPLEWVQTDPRLLRQIVSCLLSNAIRFSADGTTVAVSLGHDEKRFWFRMEDQGIGIPEKDRIHLFEPFFRASNAGEFKGTGLGLSIVKKYTELLGGTIELVPSPNGTCFEVAFPMENEGESAKT